MSSRQEHPRRLSTLMAMKIGSWLWLWCYKMPKKGITAVSYERVKGAFADARLPVWVNTLQKQKNYNQGFHSSRSRPYWARVSYFIEATTIAQTRGVKLTRGVKVTRRVKATRGVKVARRWPSDISYRLMWPSDISHGLMPAETSQCQIRCSPCCCCHHCEYCFS